MPAASPTSDAIFSTLSSVLSGGWWGTMVAAVMSFIDSLRPYSLVLSLLLFTGVVYCFLRIERIVEETYHPDVPPGSSGHGAPSAASQGKRPEQTRFERIEAHLASEKESDWRLAVLEADIMLDEMITGMGYRGDSLGEKLKGIEQSDFTTLPKAWEAHVIRNRIAHEGAAFTLTEREARRVVGLYKEVFREFRYL